MPPAPRAHHRRHRRARRHGRGRRLAGELAVPALALAKSAAIWGAAALLHTDIARDGLQVGPAVDATAALQRAVPDTLVIASGGVGALADLDALRAADVRAVVLGRALYEGSFTLEEALARC